VRTPAAITSATALSAGPFTADPRTRAGRVGTLLTADPGLTVTLAIALVLSVASAAYFARAGLTTALFDSRSRLLIARTVVEGRHAGLAQLGGIWPPFPQVYMLPFVWNDALYASGIAGAIPSAASYVLSSVFLYKLVSRLTSDRFAGVVAVVAFSGPNVLYLQSVPMSELPFIACFLGVVHFTVAWMLRGSLSRLVMAGVMACLGTLTRYEGWALVILLIGTVAVFSWRAGHRRDEIEGILLLLGLMALFGIGLWVVWNRVIFGDALYFLHSQYGTKAINSQQLGAMTAAHRPNGNLALSARVFGWAVLDNLGPVAAALGILGLARLAVGARFRPATATAVVLLLFPIPFSIAAAFLGVEVIDDPNASLGGQLTNIRYGLLVAPAAAFLAAWLAQGWWLRWPVLVACVAGSVLVWTGGLVNIQDTTTVTTSPGRATTREGAWLHDHYDGGLVLIQRRSNENLLFTSGLPLDRVVYEGDRDEWTADLADPAREVRWVVTNAGDPSTGVPADSAWLALHDQPALLDHFQLAYQDGSVQVYRR
jgi:dolichyl-phosphate-mannose-protein mannosyltransferase